MSHTIPRNDQHDLNHNQLAPRLVAGGGAMAQSPPASVPPERAGAPTSARSSFQTQLDLHPFVVDAAKARPEWDELTETAEQVFVLLYEDSNRGHFTRIPAKIIAKKLGKSVRMVWYAISQLERLGFISRTRTCTESAGKSLSEREI